VIRFKLGEDDRARLGAPEIIDFDETKLLLSEARKLQKASGFHPSDFIDGLKKGNVDALAAVVWLALSRSGVTTEYDALDFDMSKLEEVPEEGKAADPA
jgi:hypothetical protein